MAVESPLGTYTFKITEQTRESEEGGYTYTDKEGGYSATTTNDAQGAFKFTLSYELEGVGTYYYKITEMGLRPEWYMMVRPTSSR